MNKYEKSLTKNFILGSVLIHCMKSVRVPSLSGPYFLVFGLNTEIYRVNLHMQSECGNVWTRKNSEYGHFLRSYYYHLTRR